MEIKPLDHGVLNVPLSKRGNIDAQIDKYKVEQKRIEEDQRFLNKQACIARTQPALDAYKALSHDAIKLYAKRTGMSMSDARIDLKVMAQGRPAKAIGLFQMLEQLVVNTARGE